MYLFIFVITTQGQQSSLANSVKWLQTQTSTNTVLSLSLSFFLCVYLVFDEMYTIRLISLIVTLLVSTSVFFFFFFFFWVDGITITFTITIILV